MSGMDVLEEKLVELRKRLKEYELHAKQIPSLKEEISALEEEIEAADFHGDAPAVEKRALAEAPIKAAAAPEPLAKDEAQKRMKAINKKLQQIEKLKEKGGDLDADALQKVRGEAKLLKELDCLKKGEVYESDGEEPVSNFKPLPVDGESAEKRIKAIKKKLEQIDDLKKKAKGGALDAEAKAKIDSEHQFKQELAALEAGETKVVFTEPSLDDVLEKIQAEKHELERRMKAIKKKLDQVATLKKKDQGSLDADAKGKLAGEKDLKKELGEIERKIGEVNKNERERVAARLG